MSAKKPNGTVKIVTALMVAFSSLVGGVGCDERQLLSLAQQVIESELSNIATSSLSTSTGESDDFGSSMFDDADFGWSESDDCCGLGDWGF